MSPPTSRHLLMLMAIAGALLGFTLEPLVGRLVTLSFGGAVHVWAVVVLVFQTVLLAGYTWAHGVGRRWPLAHAALAVASLVSLPLSVVAAPDPLGSIGPLALTVLFGVGAPFLVTSSASVVASAWWTSDDPPWTLYAVSNAGSLAGLFAYPLILEPNLGLAAQRTLWSIGYAAFVALVVLAAWRAPARSAASASWPPLPRALQWLALSGSASALSLAVTGWIGSEFGSFPLLWTLPLGLYLGSFMLAFSSTVDSALTRSGLRGFWPEAAALVGLFGCMANEPLLHPFLYLGFLGLCWATHAALYRIRPDRSGLTPFYLLIALGGVLGSSVVTLVAPFAFPQLYEFPLAILACVLALLVAGERFDLGWFTRVHWRFAVVRGTLLPLMVGLTVVWWLPGEADIVAQERSLYGVFQVWERQGEAPYRLMLHGNTTHGAQYGPSDPRHHTPMAYFHPTGGNALGVALRRGPRVAVVGLGTGSAAAWMGPGDSLTFYELDPHNEPLARRWFTYLTPDVVVHTGDARLVLDQQEVTYDAILLDAFSGDGIPAHLLTVEALDVWWDHLTPQGVLVVHLSNRFLDLTGVIRAGALARGLHGAIRLDPAELATVDPLFFRARTAVLVRDPTLLDGLDATWTRFGDDDGLPRHDVWTDDHQNLLQPLFGG